MNANKKVKSKKLSKQKTTKNIYFGYSKRLVLTILLFSIFLILTFLFVLKSFNYYEPEIINYKENSVLDYKVYLKENNFYGSEYLGKDMLYIASLIDKIVIDFNYLFDIDKVSSINFDYKIYAKLLITNSNSGKTYFEKEYDLLKNKEYKMINKDSYKLFEKVSIDYDYYNSLANNFKQSYGIDMESNLLVYLKINKKDMNNDFKLNDQSIMLITIPLSQKSIDIKMDYEEINNSSYLVSEKNIILDNILYVILASVCLIVSIINAIKTIRLLALLKTKKSNYDKFVKKILIEYDRLIVENSTGPNLDKNNVIKINKFEELLDVRDNLKLPIMYYNVIKHHKCYFYIKHNEDVYLMTVKSTDLDASANDIIRKSKSGNN